MTLVASWFLQLTILKIFEPEVIVENYVMKITHKRIVFALLIAIIASANISQTGLAIKSSQSADTPSLCPIAGQIQNNIIFQDNMENGSANWTFSADTGYSSNWEIGTPGISSLNYSLQAPDATFPNDSWAEMKRDLSLPSGGYYLYFYHTFNLEEYSGEKAYDGSVLEYNTGSGWQDAGSLFSAGQEYNFTIMGGYSNPLEPGRRVFSGSSNGIVGSRFNLSDLAGQSVRFRWRIGTDINVGSQTGWFVDDVQIYTCADNPFNNKFPKSDFNGDGVSDVAVFRPSNGYWYVNGQFAVQFGGNGDIPVPGDYNGDGVSDVAVFRPSNGVWYVNGQFAVQYGGNGDIPVPGDYNGDGVSDVAVFRPSNGVWYVKDQFAVQYGGNGDIPVPGYYIGDNTTDVAIFRPSNGVWYVKDQPNYSIQYGGSGDIPVLGDYNKDGKTDVAVFRPSNGVWYVKDLFAVQYGGNGDIPIPPTLR